MGRRQSSLPRKIMDRRQSLYHVNYLTKFSEDPNDGSYEIVQVNTNGTVHLQMGAVTDTVNIHLLKPYKV
jgi:hypothetical protein